jgi:chemotaxis protein MotB
MKNILLLIAIAFVASCAPHKACDSTVQDKPLVQKLYTKRYKTSLHERDSLCTQTKTLQLDTTTLGKLLRSERKKLADTEQEFYDLKKTYDFLKKSTGEELAKLSETLTKKGIELEEKQKKVDHLENLLAERQAMLDNLFASIKKALVDFSPSELTVELKDGKLYVSLLDKLLFKSGSAEVEARGIEALQKLGAVLKNDTTFEISVEGHTDNLPIKNAVYRDNWDLSTYRASSVVRLLIDNKVSPARLTSSGKGEFHPIATNDSPEGRSKNRRTEIILVPDLSEIMNLIK